MSVDYDLVILGGSSAGVYAAVTAARSLHARVALVEPDSLLEVGSRECGLMALHQVSQFQDSLAQASQLGWVEMGARDRLQDLNFDRPIRWASEVLCSVSAAQSPVMLSGLGIDVIQGEGEFCREPRLAVMANGRVLRSRRYLMATGSRWATPQKIDGLSRVGYLTPETLGYWVKKGQTLPENFVIIGNDPQGVQLAQILTRLGTSVTLITHRSQILPCEDPEMASWIQAKLEAEGVRILTQTPVTQARKIQGKRWVQAGDVAIETDEILVAIARVANLQSLNLGEVGVECHRRIVLTDRHLQTTNPRIYACGSALGGYAFEGVARYEAKIACQNALLRRQFCVDYHSIPWSISVDPPLARVGFTEPQARRRYGSDVLIFKQSFQGLAQAQICGKTTGFCKAIVRKNGTILGVHIWGAAAEELIHPFVLAIGQKLTLEALAEMVPIDPSFSQLYHNLGMAWRGDRHSRNKNRHTRLKNWHNWQRDRLD